MLTVSGIYNNDALNSGHRYCVNMLVCSGAYCTRLGVSLCCESERADAVNSNAAAGNLGNESLENFSRAYFSEAFGSV